MYLKSLVEFWTRDQVQKLLFLSPLSHTQRCHWQSMDNLDNIPFIFVHEDVSKLDISKYFKEIQFLNICSISVTLEVSKWDKSKEVNK